MPSALEDNYVDVIRKAMRGLAFNEGVLAKRAGIDTSTLQAVLAGERDEAVLAAVARCLGLGEMQLIGLARSQALPEVQAPQEGFAMFSNPHDEGVVNFYIVWHPTTRQAAVFDSGYDASDLLALVKNKSLQVQYLFLTHTHGDHVFDADRIVEKTGARMFYGRGENFAGGEPFDAGREFHLGALRISTRATAGHSAGGVTYVVKGLGEAPLAIVGDALFARSMGGPIVSYEQCLKTNRESLFTLPDATIVCPGHGPLTTIALEKTHNPFFPEYAR